jgi:uncharacterized protein (DUF1697 family)
MLVPRSVVLRGERGRERLNWRAGKIAAYERQPEGGMASYIALLRGINVGGHRMIAMSVLCEFLEAVGCERPRSLLQSGNLVFGSEKRTAGDVERWLEAEAAKRLKISAEFFVRTPKEWRDVIARNPFRDEAERDPARLHLIVLKKAPTKPGVAALRAAIVGREVVASGSRHLYAVYPDGAGTSRLTAAVIDSKLGTRCTARNWNTVLKLAAAS